MNNDLYKKLLLLLEKDISDLQIKKIEKGHGDFLLIHLGDSEKIIYPSGDTETRSPWIFWLYMCEWRILKDNIFYIGSGDDDEILQSNLDKLCLKRFQKAQINKDTFDLTLLFEDNYIIQTFSNMKDDNQWQLHCPDGLTFTLGSNSEIVLEE